MLGSAALHVFGDARVPVNIRWSSGRALKAAPAAGPPVITASSSGEKYRGASVAMSAEVRGVASGILISTRFPAAKAAVAAMTARTTGPLMLRTMPTTPKGCACTVVRRPSGRPIRITGRGFIHLCRLRRICAKSLTEPRTSMTIVI